MKTRCFIGYTTIKKRSSEIEAIVRTDTAVGANRTGCIVQYHSVGIQYENNGPIKQVKRSETAKFPTRYVPEFLKHFNGSFYTNAIMRSTCEITPKIQIKFDSMLMYPNSKPFGGWLAVMLIACIERFVLLFSNHSFNIAKHFVNSCHAKSYINV